MESKENVLNSVYADFSNISFNLHNFTLYFGGVEENVPQIFGKVKMSPESLKQFAKILNNNIESYEEIYGEIKTYTPEIAKKEKEFIEKQKNNEK